MLERSFYQFQHFSAIPALYEKLQLCEQQYQAIKIENEDDIAGYYKIQKKLEQIQEQMSTMTNEPKYLLPFLQPGRLVTVRRVLFSDSRQILLLIFRSNLEI